MMKHRFDKLSALFSCSGALLFALLAGCGATSTAGLRGTGTGSTGSTAVPISRGPQLGYFWSASTANLYPILGVTGAAHFGEALLTVKYASGVVGGGATHAWALLLDASGTLTEVRLPALTTSVVATRIAPDAMMVLSPSASVAAIASPSAGTVLVLTSLATTAQTAELAAPTGARLAGVAISDIGTVLAGWTKPGSKGVQVGTLTAQGASAITTLTKWGGAAFAPSSGAAGTDQAVIADASSAQLSLVTAVGSAAPVITPLATGGLLQTPVAVALSSDAKFAFAADSAKQQLVRVDLTGISAPSSIACPCQPAYLLPLAGTSVYAVTADSPGQPAWMLDTRATATRTFFVPALAIASTGQAGSSAANARQAAR